jgi:hypothetical protein
VSPRSSLARLLGQSMCEHPGLALELALCLSPEKPGAQPTLVAVDTSGEPDSPYCKAFQRWREILSVLGAETWEIDLVAGVPLSLLPGLDPSPALHLHEVYATPRIPSHVLAALAGLPQEHGDPSEGPSGSGPGGGDIPDIDGAPSVRFLDAWYVPGTAPENRPIAPFSEGDGEPDHVTGKDSVRTAAASGRYLIAAVGPEPEVSAVRQRLTLAIRHAWGIPVAAAPGEEAAGEPTTEAPAEPVAAAVAAAAEVEPPPSEPEGPWEWGLRHVVLVPQDGSLRAEGPSGEKGIAVRAEAEALMAGLPGEAAEQFSRRKRRAKLLVTVEPRGNVWRIIGLEVQTTSGEASPEEP